MKIDTENLKKCVLFRGISDDEIAQMCVCLHFTERRYESGEAIWHAGDAVEKAGVVLEGGVTAEHSSASGARTLAARHGVGDVFGDVLMSTDGAHSPVDILAQSGGARVIFLSFSDIMSGCEKQCRCHDKLRRNLLSQIAAKFWALRRRTEILSAGGLRARAAALLLTAARDADSLEFSLIYNRENMADFLCVNRAALSRELSGLEAQGIIAFRKNRFRILDREALERLLHRGLSES